MTFVFVHLGIAETYYPVVVAQNAGGFLVESARMTVNIRHLVGEKLPDRITRLRIPCPRSWFKTVLIKRGGVSRPLN